MRTEDGSEAGYSAEQDLALVAQVKANTLTQDTLRQKLEEHIDQVAGNGDKNEEGRLCEFCGPANSQLHLLLSHLFLVFFVFFSSFFFFFLFLLSTTQSKHWSM